MLILEDLDGLLANTIQQVPLLSDDRDIHFQYFGDPFFRERRAESLLGSYCAPELWPSGLRAGVVGCFEIWTHSKQLHLMMPFPDSRRPKAEAGSGLCQGRTTSAAERSQSLDTDRASATLAHPGNGRD